MSSKLVGRAYLCVFIFTGLTFGISQVSTANPHGHTASKSNPPKKTKKVKKLTLDPNQPIATVNQKAISRTIFDRHIALLLSRSKKKEPSFRFQAMSARKSIRLLVREEMLTQELKKHHLQSELSTIKKNVETRKQALKKIHNSDAKFRTYINKRGHTQETFDIYLWNKEALYVLMKSQYELKPTETEIKDLYERMKSMFIRPAQVRAKQILIELTEKSTAEDINKAFKKAQKSYEDIMAGKMTFTQILQRDSEGPLKHKFGDLGYFSKGEMVEPIEKVVFAMKDGDVSMPVRTRYGWHVLKRMGSIPSYKKEISEVREMLVERLRKSKLHKKRSTYLKSLFKTYKIESQVKI